MVDIIKLTAALVVISMIAGLAIGFTNDKTRGEIAEQQRLAQELAVEAVFPQGVTISEHKGSGEELPKKYWSASANGEITGYAFEISVRGYAGEIKFMAGLDAAGRIIGMTVLEQNETPGLGSRMTEVVSNKYIWYPAGSSEKVKPWFTEQFEGLSSLMPITIEKGGEWHKLDASKRAGLRDKNAVTAITGSTISTRAVTKGIEQKAAAYINALNASENNTEERELKEAD